MYLAESAEDEVFEEFASDATCAHHQHTRLYYRQYTVMFAAPAMRPGWAASTYLFDSRIEVGAEALAHVFVASHGHQCVIPGRTAVLRKWKKAFVGFEAPQVPNVTGHRQTRSNYRE